MLKKIFAMILIMCMFIPGCSGHDREEGNGFKIYRANSNFDTLVWEYAEKETYSIDEALELLYSNPRDDDMAKLVPDGVEVKSHEFGQDGQLILDFNQLYSNMDMAAELMCRAGVVKTLSQIDGIEYIEFLVEGSPLTLSGGTIVRQMAAEDFIDNTGTDAKYAQSVSITIYFADATGKMMSESILRVEYDGLRTLEEIVLYELIEGPLPTQTNLFPVMPEGTAVNKVSSRDGICTVDVNSAFLAGREGVSSDVIVYSIVNSLVDISYINKVQITVDGNNIKNYGDITISGLLGRRPELITTEKAGESTE